MDTYYTKAQLDAIAVILGTKISQSVNLNSVSAAINSSKDYVLMTGLERAKLNNIAEPASGVDSFLYGLEGISSNTTQYITLTIPTQETFNGENLT